MGNENADNVAVAGGNGGEEISRGQFRKTIELLTLGEVVFALPLIIFGLPFAAEMMRYMREKAGEIIVAWWLLATVIYVILAGASYMFLSGEIKFIGRYKHKDFGKILWVLRGIFVVVWGVWMVMCFVG